jgi:5-methylcytosine-specific restriction endonuclease McrA
MQGHDFYESREWLDLRYRFLKTTRGWCQLCGHKGSPDNPVHVDHIKPRSKFPELALAESNLQVLCRRCNLGKSNTDSTDWRNAPTREFAILQACDPGRRGKLQQLGYLRTSSDIDVSMRRIADRQYRELWQEIERDFKQEKTA